MTSPTALVRLRLPALLTVLATVVLLLGAGARGHAAPVSRALSPAAPTPSPSATAGGSSQTAVSSLAMLMPAPTQADLSDATLEVPESCALRTSPSDATRGATGTVTFSGGQAASPPGAREYLPSATTTIKNVTSSVIDGRPVAVATISCFYGGAYTDDAIVVYDSGLSLVAAIDPKALREDIGGRIQDASIDAVFANAANGDLVLSLSRIGVYGDGPIHADLHSGSANALYTWAGGARGARGYTVSDVVYTAGGTRVRVPRTEDVQAFVDAVIAHDDDRAAQWATRDLMRSLDSHAQSTTTTIRDAYMPKGTTVEECGLLPSLTEPDSQGTSHVFLNDDHDVTIRPGGSQVIPGAYYQAGDVMCVMSGAKGSWLMLHGKEDGGV